MTHAHAQSFVDRQTSRDTRHATHADDGDDGGDGGDGGDGALASLSRPAARLASAQITAFCVNAACGELHAGRGSRVPDQGSRVADRGSRERRIRAARPCASSRLHGCVHALARGRGRSLRRAPRWGSRAATGAVTRAVMSSVTERTFGSGRDASCGLLLIARSGCARLRRVACHGFSFSFHRTVELPLENAVQIFGVWRSTSTGATAVACEMLMTVAVVHERHKEQLR